MNTRSPLCVIVVLFLFGGSSFAQPAFEQGYFIDNNGDRVSCLIKNLDWKDNPKKITYRRQPDSPPTVATLDDLQEFSIDGVARFVRAKVKIDRSSEQNAQLKYKDRQPNWSTETLFLEVLLEGTASLYLYRENITQRFFFKATPGDTISQLVYKKYLNTQRDIVYNNRFRQQLWATMNCEDKPVDRFNYVRYTEPGLLAFFKEYHQCLNASFDTFKPDASRGEIRISLVPGLNFAGATLSSSVQGVQDLNFGLKAGTRIGLEVEYVLPIKNKVWSIVLEPTWQTLRDEAANSQNSGKLSFTNIEFPLGGRRYFPLYAGNKLYLDVFYVSNFTVAFDSSIDIDGGDTFDISTGNGIAAGLGIQVKRFRGGLRFYSNTELLNDFLGAISAKYSRVLLYGGYRLF